MPICSYIVFPHPGKKDQLARDLNAIYCCQTQRAETQDLLLLLTETQSKREEKALLDRLESMRDIQCLVLSFGALDDEEPAISTAVI